MSLFNLVQVILLNFLGGRIGSTPLTKLKSELQRIPSSWGCLINKHRILSAAAPNELVRDVGTFQEPFYTSNRFSCFHSQVEFVLSHDIQHAHVMPHSPVLGETPAGFHGHLAKSPNIAKEGLLGKAIALQADPEQSSNKFLQGKKSSNSLNSANGVKFDYIALLRRIATHPAWSDSASPFDLLQTALVPFVIYHYQQCSFVTAI